MQTISSIYDTLSTAIKSGISAERSSRTWQVVRKI